MLCIWKEVQVSIQNYVSCVRRDLRKGRHSGAYDQ